MTSLLHPANLGIAAGVLLFVVLFAYIFLLRPDTTAAPEKSRLAYLQERKEVIYDNLRDLNFDFKAGKVPDTDYESLRGSLEDEAAQVLAEIASLERGEEGERA